MTETGNKSSVNMVRNMVLRRAIQGSEFTPKLLRILANDTEKGMSSSLRNQNDEKGLQKLTNSNNNNKNTKGASEMPNN